MAKNNEFCLFKPHFFPLQLRFCFTKRQMRGLAEIVVLRIMGEFVYITFTRTVKSEKGPGGGEISTNGGEISTNGGEISTNGVRNHATAPL